MWPLMTTLSTRYLVPLEFEIIFWRRILGQSDVNAAQRLGDFERAVQLPLEILISIISDNAHHL